MPEESIPKRWLTVAEAATYLGLPSVKALHQAARRDNIPRYKWGTRIRFDIADLDALMVPDERQAEAAERIDLDVDAIIADMGIKG